MLGQPLRHNGMAWKIPGLPAVVFLVLLIFLLAMPENPMLRDLDVGWLIRDGEFILKNRSIPVGDIYSFTNLGRPWILYKWGFELYLGAMHQMASLGGVVWGTAIIIAFTYSLLLGYLLYQGLDRWTSVGLVYLAIFTNIFYFYARPTTPTFLFYLLTLIILEEYRRNPGKQYWLLPPLFLVWVNIHLGFIVAFGAVGLYGLTAWFFPLWFRGPGSSRDAKLLMILPFCFLALLANPYGYGLLVKIWQHSNDDLVKKGITTEMRSPDFHEIMFLFLFAQISLIILIRGRQYSGRPLLLTLTLVTLYLGLYSVRHVPYFSITATLHLALAIGPARKIEKEAAIGHQDGWGWALLGVVATLIFVIGINSYRPGFYSFIKRSTPIATSDYLAAHLDSDKVVRIFCSSEQWSSYFIYRLYPNALVFFDSRYDLYGDDFRRKFNKILQEVYTNPEVLRPWQVDFLVLEKEGMPSQLPNDYRWPLVYEDSQTLVYQCK